MKKTQITAIAFAAVVLTVLGGMALAQQDKYTLKVPGGLAFSEFRGYEGWQVVATSQSGKLVAAILANPAMIEAYLRTARCPFGSARTRCNFMRRRLTRTVLAADDMASELQC